MEWTLPAHWETVEFVSDVHLHAQAPATLARFRHYLEQTRTHAIFILGDLFEVWVGDDTLDDPSPFERVVLEALQQAALRRPLFFVPGNRDFLVGPRLLQATGMHCLSDPCVLVSGPQRLVISHGDALCWADTAYMAFRREVRSQPWQERFLSRSLAERRQQAAAMRQASQAQQAQRAKEHANTPYGDVHPDAVLDLLHQCAAPTLVHGHTHHPLTHTIGMPPQGASRWVLSDWDADSHPVRAQVLRWDLAPHSDTLVPSLRRIEWTTDGG